MPRGRADLAVHVAESLTPVPSCRGHEQGSSLCRSALGRRGGEKLENRNPGTGGDCVATSGTFRRWSESFKSRLVGGSLHRDRNAGDRGASSWCVLPIQLYVARIRPRLYAGRDGDMACGGSLIGLCPCCHGDYVLDWKKKARGPGLDGAYFRIFSPSESLDMGHTFLWSFHPSSFPRWTCPGRRRLAAHYWVLLRLWLGAVSFFPGKHRPENEEVEVAGSAPVFVMSAALELRSAQKPRTSTGGPRYPLGRQNHRRKGTAEVVEVEACSVLGRKSFTSTVIADKMARDLLANQAYTKRVARPACIGQRFSGAGEL